MAKKHRPNPRTRSPEAPKYESWGYDEAFCAMLRNTDNRRMRPGRIKQYALDMTENRWRPRSVISFMENGRLINGQHRLAALMMAADPTTGIKGLRVTFLIVRDAEEEDGAVMDTGDVRTYPEQAEYLGIVTTRPMMAVAKFLRTGRLQLGQFSPADVFDFHERHTVAIKFGVSVVPKVKGVLGVAVVPVWSVFAMAWYTEGEATLERLGSILADGFVSKGALRKGDHSLIQLRNVLLGGTDSRKLQGGRRNRNVFFMTQRALKHALVDSKIGPVFSQPCSLFRLPDDYDQSRVVGSDETKSITLATNIKEWRKDAPDE